MANTLSKPKILVVDDDPGIRQLLSDYLEEQGLQTTLAANSQEMRARLSESRHDLIILDLMMPGEDGLTTLRQLQTEAHPPTVIMLSAFGTTDDRVTGLNVGADDFIQKPCDPRELLARIRAALRRRRQEADSSASQSPNLPRLVLYRFEGWTLDARTQTLFDPRDTIINLSDGEFRMLLALVEAPQRVLSRSDLLDLVFGIDSEPFDRVVDVQISRLRRKIAGRAGSLELIRTIRNEGYLFVPDVTRG